MWVEEEEAEILAEHQMAVEVVGVTWVVGRVWPQILVVEE